MLSSMSRVRILALSLMIPFLTPLPVKAQTGVGEFVSGIFEENVKIARADLENLDHPKEVEEFYAARDGDPFWHTRKGKLKDEAEILHKKLQDSWRHGLNPETYQVDLLEKMMAENKPEDIVALDLLLTNSFMRYVRDLSGARVNVALLGFNPDDWLKPYPPAEILTFLSETKDFNDFEEEILPDSETYKKLQVALEALMADEADNPEESLPQISFNRAVEPGQSHPGIPALRERMGLQPRAPEIANKYDDELASTVMRFQRDHGLKVDGILGEQTVHMLSQGRRDMIKQIIANLERLRWAPHDRPKRFVVVNVPSAKLWAIEDNKLALEMDVLVGKPKRPTQPFIAKITGIRFNPDWTVPPTIKREDMIPAVMNDPEYFRKKGIEIYDHDGKETYRVDPTTIPWDELTSKELHRLRMVQPPGSYNPLGQYRVIMPNKYNIYLHDTNEKSKFDRSQRSVSSGCVRMSKPKEMAEFILSHKKDWTVERMDKMVSSGRRSDVMIDEDLPVYIFYYTVWVNPDGQLIFGRDIYDYDKKLIALLSKVDGFFLPGHN